MGTQSFLLTVIDKQIAKIVKVVLLTFF